jgi:hypothetical protein
MAKAIIEKTLEEELGISLEESNSFKTRIETKPSPFQDNRQKKFAQHVPGENDPIIAAKVRAQMKADVARDTEKIAGENVFKDNGTRVKFCGNSSKGERCKSIECENWETSLLDRFGTGCVLKADKLNSLGIKGK